jgi:hypothetical protein
MSDFVSSSLPILPDAIKMDPYLDNSNQAPSDLQTSSSASPDAPPAGERSATISVTSPATVQPPQTSVPAACLACVSLIQPSSHSPYRLLLLALLLTPAFSSYREAL